jgi:hypothetical protein
MCTSASAQGERLTGPLPHPRLVQRRRAGDDLAAPQALGLPHRERLGDVAVEGVEVGIGVVVAIEESEVGVVVGEMEHRQIVAGELDGEPPPLDGGEVTQRPVPAEPGRRDALFGQPPVAETAHMSVNVSRRQSRNALSVSRSPPTAGGRTRVSPAPQGRA